MARTAAKEGIGLKKKKRTPGKRRKRVDAPTLLDRSLPGSLPSLPSLRPKREGDAPPNLRAAICTGHEDHLLTWVELAGGQDVTRRADSSGQDAEHE